MSSGNISLTAALRANLLSLQSTGAQMDVTQLRLATGRKVNTALDSPVAFFAAQGLNNRAADLSNLLDGMGQSINVLKAADNGITTLTKMTQQLKALAQSANSQVANSGLARSGDISAALQANLGAIASTLDLTSSTTGVTSNIVVSGQSLAQVASAINAVPGLSAQIVDVGGGATTNRRLEIRATGGATLTIGNNAAATFFQANNGGAGGLVGARGDTGGTIAGGVAIATTQNPPDQISFEKQYNAIRTQIDNLINDTGYQGTNLLNGDNLRTQFNEKNTTSQTITGVVFNSAGLALTTGTGALTNVNTINATLVVIESAITTLRAQAQTFGNSLTIVQNRQDFTKNLINNLKGGADALVLADKNEEGANLLSLQTSQQLGIQALSLASQANQAVLQLFR